MCSDQYIGNGFHSANLSGDCRLWITDWPQHCLSGKLRFLWPNRESPPMKFFVWFLVALLVILHQDYWFDAVFGLLNIDGSHWHNSTLVFGFLPHTLVYHAAISIAAGVVWWMATKYCWPRGIDEPTPEADKEPSES